VVVHIYVLLYSRKANMVVAFTQEHLAGMAFSKEPKSEYADQKKIAVVRTALHNT
jgi:hypothetical protein